MNDQTSTTLTMVLKQEKSSLLFPLFQEGFQVAAKVGCDIQTLLCEQFGLMPDYLANRISTIFLNGKPLDDVSSAVIMDGATLALSAAMPGLVGATFRKAGHLAAFRGSITYRKKEDGPTTCHDGFVTLKLFNLLISEMGPPFLERGIWVNGRVLRGFLNLHQTDIHTIFKEFKKNGIDLTPHEIADLSWITDDARYYLQATNEP
ncbi:MAG: hypothetical protein PVI54_07945 [Desulfobacteraceae bacterium]